MSSVDLSLIVFKTDFYFLLSNVGLENIRLSLMFITLILETLMPGIKSRMRICIIRFITFLIG